MKSIIVDMDDVLIDLNGQVEKEVQAMGYSDFKVENILTYDLNKSIIHENLPIHQKLLQDHGLGCPREVIIEKYGDINVFKKCCDISYDNMKALKKLSEKYNVVIHTLSFNSDILFHKAEYLTSVLRDFKIAYSFALGSIKLGYNGDVIAVFEDCLENLTCYNDTTKKLLIDKPYNRDVYNSHLLSELSNIERVRSFSDGVKLLL